MQLTIASDMESLQKALAILMGDGKRIALVPTMGALHAGHLSLIERGKEEADAVVVSLFVNPKQFGKNEDFSKYPRTLEADTRKIKEAGAALLYAPSAEDIYPEGFSTTVSVGEIGAIMEGQFRPGFFDGVATVVTKLLLRTLPHVALFGEKDYQQLCVINQLVSDLDIPVDIIGVPTMREADGLAMASRNVYLTAEERKIAPKLHETLQRVGNAIVSGVAIKPLLDQSVANLNTAGFKVDYLELREEDTLDALIQLDAPARLLAAAWLGQTRLIDNIAVSPES